MSIIFSSFFIVLLLLVFQSEITRLIERINTRKKIKLFLDSRHSTMYISPAKKTTDDELEMLVDKYNDTYQVKIIDKHTEIKGITEYIVDFTQNKKGQ